MKRREAHPHIARLIAIAAVFVALVVLGFGVMGNSQSPTVTANSAVRLSINAGRFAVHTPLSAKSSNRRKTIDVFADEQLCLRFQSEDFLYAVSLTELSKAAVILPGSSAVLDVVLPTGHWELRIVQGCGSLSPDHAQVVYLHSISRRGR